MRTMLALCVLLTGLLDPALVHGAVRHKGVRYEVTAVLVQPAGVTIYYRQTGDPRPSSGTCRVAQLIGQFPGTPEAIFKAAERTLIGDPSSSLGAPAKVALPGGTPEP